MQDGKRKREKKKKTEVGENCETDRKRKSLQPSLLGIEFQLDDDRISSAKVRRRFCVYLRRTVDCQLTLSSHG